MTGRRYRSRRPNSGTAASALLIGRSFGTSHSVMANSRSRRIRRVSGRSQYFGHKTFATKRDRSCTAISAWPSAVRTDSVKRGSSLRSTSTVVVSTMPVVSTM